MLNEESDKRNGYNGQIPDVHDDRLLVVESGKCFICSNNVDFSVEKNFSRREALCPVCNGTRRSRDLAKTIVSTFAKDATMSISEVQNNLRDLAIYETQASGPIHDCLKTLPGYACSEYLDDIQPGDSNERGIRCENLERLTFPDDIFDLVITQDVMEHVSNPEAAFKEIRRVLKPGGYHIFTIPFHEGRNTVTRIKEEEGTKIFNVSPVNHGDPLRKTGSLVYTDFGEDIIEKLKKLGMDTEIAIHDKFYEKKAIPWINDQTSHQLYEKYREKGEVLKYLLYNSVVLRSRKKNIHLKVIPECQNGNNSIEWTGERYVPWADAPITTYEHLHRYRLVKTIVRGKKVLDLGCGEGYGTCMLSEDAAHVTGIDIDDSAVRHASYKYIRDNIAFVRGSMSEVPLEGHSLFDVIVCFEALEHINAHDQLLSEVKRLLKKDGIFIISTPNKTIYTEGTGYKNPFHVKELYFNEFNDLLSDNFKNVLFYGQKIYPSSNIFPLNRDSVFSRSFVIEKGTEAFHFVPSRKRVAEYYIAIASDTAIDNDEVAFDSHLIDISEALIRQKDSCADELRHQIEKLKVVIDKKNMRIADLEEATRENDQRIHQSAGLAKKVMDALPSLENLLKGLEREILAPAVSLEAGELCFNLGLMDTAGNFFKKAIATDPENSDALNNLGVLEIHKGNVESARNYFMRALSVSPGNREAKINLDMLQHSPDMAGVAHSCSADAAGKGTV